MMNTTTNTEALVTLNGQPLTMDLMVELGIEVEVGFEQYVDAYCYVCRRCTDHVAEHDDLIEAGLAEYDCFQVVLTEAGRAARMAGVL